MSARTLILTLLALLAPRLVQAATYTPRFCFRFEVDYTDRTGGDNWNDTSDKTAVGIRARVTRNSDGANLFNEYTDLNGCTPLLSMSSTDSYTVRMYSEAKLTNGNFINVRNDDASEARYYYTAASSFTPSGTYTYTYVWPVNSTYVSNIVAAAAYALNKRYAGMTNQTFVLYNQAAGGGGSGTVEPGIVYLSSSGRTRKYIIAHELGHAVLIRRAGGDSADASYDYQSPMCSEYGNTPHDLASEEYNHSAANEGFAHFYAATVWNNQTENDCSFYYYKSLDLDKNGVADTNQDYSCENGVKYQETMCGPYTIGIGVELDWLRFFWDLHTDGGLTFGAIVDIVAGSDPKSWTSISVYARMRSAAGSQGIGPSIWETWGSYNGVNH